MLKSYKYRLYPNKEQAILLQKHFGCARWAYNWGLTEKKKALNEQQKITCFDIINKIVALKKEKEFSWLGEVNSQSTHMAVRNLDNAFTRFFNKQEKFPNFKSKKHYFKSFSCPQGCKVYFETGFLQIPKFIKDNKIKVQLHRIFKGKIKTVTISQKSSGNYFASILVETTDTLPIKRVIKESMTIGIDTGIKTFLTCSNGVTFENHRFLNKSLKKLARLNRAHGRKKKDSKNREKARLKLAIQHEKISNQRKDYIHKVTHKLTNDNQVGTICVETLDVAGLLKKRILSRNLADVGLGLFYQTLAYKCEWKGINLIKIGKYEPSSKACHKCGTVNHNLTLADRQWICVCGANHDRDMNAAINIKNFGLLSSSSKIRQELPESTLGETRNSESANQETAPLGGSSSRVPVVK